jgi:hypothetical protein
LQAVYYRDVFIEGLLVKHQVALDNLRAMRKRQLRAEHPAWTCGSARLLLFTRARVPAIEREVDCCSGMYSGCSKG